MCVRVLCDGRLKPLRSAYKLPDASTVKSTGSLNNAFVPFPSANPTPLPANVVTAECYGHESGEQFINGNRTSVNKTNYCEYSQTKTKVGLSSVERARNKTKHRCSHLNTLHLSYIHKYIAIDVQRKSISAMRKNTSFEPPVGLITRIIDIGYMLSLASHT
jgi:hypothetical protein